MNSNFYKWLLTLTLFASLGPTIYFLVELQPSTVCGPYRGLDSFFDIIGIEISRTVEPGKSILVFLSGTSFLVGLTAVGLVVLYYFRAVAKMRGRVINSLKLQLSKAREDQRALVLATKEQQRR